MLLFFFFSVSFGESGLNPKQIMRMMQNSSINSGHSCIPHSSGSSDHRRRGLLRLDRELRKGNHDDAVAVAKQLRRQHLHGLRGFGSAKQVPRSLLSDDVEEKGMKLAHIKPLVDSMLDSIGRCMDDLKREEILVRTEEDADDEESNEEDPMYDPEYDLHMCARHEAGHFLTGYLLGVLPKAYILPLPGKDGLCERLRIGGAVKFVGFEFLREVPEGSMSTESVTSARRERSPPQEHQCNTKYVRPISSKTFNNFTCIVLGGLAAEQLSFGHSEGYHSDIHQLTRVIEWLNLTDSTAEAHIRWATTNTATILNRHCQTISRLAEVMASRATIGCCIETIEDSISFHEQV